VQATIIFINVNFLITNYSNKMLTDSPLAIRVMALENIGATEIVRILDDLVTASVAQIESVMTSDVRSDEFIRSTALPDRTPCEM
jgi:hypothetical protein